MEPPEKTGPIVKQVREAADTDCLLPLLTGEDFLVLFFRERIQLGDRQCEQKIANNLHAREGFWGRLALEAGIAPYRVLHCAF